ncbi:MAG: hypothetical protein WC730_02075 [Patescibacteria group bacterium]
MSSLLVSFATSVKGDGKAGSRGDHLGIPRTRMLLALRACGFEGFGCGKDQTRSGLVRELWARVRVGEELLSVACRAYQARGGNRIDSWEGRDSLKGIVQNSGLSPEFFEPFLALEHALEGAVKTGSRERFDSALAALPVPEAPALQPHERRSFAEEAEEEDYEVVRPPDVYTAED